MESADDNSDIARWRRLESLFNQAVELPPTERAALLEAECAGDEALMAEVVSMLESSASEDSFLGEPVFNLGVSALAAERAGSLIGQTVGPYKVLRLIGQGGMGEVYLAEDPRLERNIALKLLSETATRLLSQTLTSDPVQAARFESEARNASAVSHPHVAHVYEKGEDRGRLYIAMEYVEGEDLGCMLKRGPLALGRALEIASQVASVLSAAHAAGVVHCDIKPANVVVRPDGYIKVVDFGIALRRTPKSLGGDATEGTVLGLGTAPYMSPEQLRDEEVDGRTDVWSLGVLLFEMVAGRAPFRGVSLADVFHAILNSEPSFDALPAGSPYELRLIIDRALQKKRNDRYPTAEEMLADLNKLRRRLEVTEELERSASPALRSGASLDGVSGVGAARSWPSTLDAEVMKGQSTSRGPYLRNNFRRNMTGITVGLIMILLGVAGVAYKQKSSRRGAPLTPSIVAVRGMKPRTLTTSGHVLNAALSGDGKYIAYSLDEGFSRIRLLRMADGDEKDVVSSNLEVYRVITFSPNGDYLYCPRRASAKLCTFGARLSVATHLAPC